MDKSQKITPVDFIRDWGTYVLPYMQEVVNLNLSWLTIFLNIKIASVCQYFRNGGIFGKILLAAAICTMCKQR